MILDVHLIVKLKKMLAPINKIINFSNVDGPGNRCVIFFQSCPFKCLYCHNPETINYCNHCQKCVDKCMSSALSVVDNKVVYDSNKCINCDTCISVCDNFASPKINYMSVNDIIVKLIKLKPFIKGITVSGGECTNHKQFLIELFKEVKKLDLHILMDSNGNIDLSIEEELMDLVDGVMLDVKSVDDKFHYILTSKSCDMVLNNLDYLLSVDKLYEARTVLLPNFMVENLKTVNYVSKKLLLKSQYKLIKYRKYGVSEKGVDFFKDDTINDEDVKECLEIALKYCNNSFIV